MVDSTGSENSGEAEDFQQIAQRLGEPRRELLQSFLRADISAVNTADLREHTSVSRGSVLHHLERLMSWGLIDELPERQYHGRGGREARTWQLTDRGREFCKEYMDAPPDAFVSPEDVATLEQRMDRLEDDFKDVKGIMMQLGVHTDMLTKKRARKEMGEEWFQEVFES